MKKHNLFFLISLITILILRLGITWKYFFGTEQHLVIYGHIIHHFWIGVLLVIAGLLISRRFLARLIVLGIGFGYIVDELVFIILGSGGYSVYLAWSSWVGMIVMLLLVFIFRKKISEKLV